MTAIAKRESVSKVDRRDFTCTVGGVNYTVQTGSRIFLAKAPSRDFGPIQITGWKYWGQVDITPFDYPTGVDSTKTFEQLPSETP
jgi:hypothetical protein